MKDSLAAIFSVSGPRLSEAEKSFFRSSNPLGFILFARNCETPKQLRELTDSLREAVGRDCPVLIDQEGGRVQRLKPPHWRQYPPMRVFGEMAESEMPPSSVLPPHVGGGSPVGTGGGKMEKALEALRFTILQLAEELQAAGLDVNCAPVLDVLTLETHDAIGDRAFSYDPAIVARLGLCVARNLLAAGITPVMKHIPGHGRAAMDSHHDLPVVAASMDELEKTDFVPFKSLAGSDVAPALWGMTAHVVFSAIDPERPITVSKEGIERVIRGKIGFDGFLLSDDLEMKALGRYGDMAARAGLVIGAGCDAALYCAGKLPEMEKIAESVPKLSQKALGRLQKAAEYIRLAA